MGSEEMEEIIKEMLEWIKLNRVQHKEGFEHPPGICSSCDLIRKAEGRE